MTDTIPDLWPAEYSDRGPLSPQQILESQAKILAARSTQLATNVKCTDQPGVRILEFMLSLTDGSHTTRLCALYHPPESCFPVQMNAEGFGHHVAETQQQFINLLAELLRHTRVRESVNSLLAIAARKIAASNGSPHPGPIASTNPASGNSAAE